MSGVLSKVAVHLRRPLPELVAFAADKLRSRLWRRHLAQVGSRFHVCRGAQLQGGECIRIGEGFYAGQMLWIEAVRRYREFTFEPLIEIGNGVICSQRVHIAATARVTIEDGVLFGSGVHVTDHGHGTYRGDTQDSPDVPPALRRPATGRPVRICRNVWLGDNVVVLPGVTIGEGSIVGANSVVSRDLPMRVIAVGAPAVPVKFFDPVIGRWATIPDHP
ncbi:acyltransferase [Ideonella azotifigens]|uniref:Acyltransferase n=1 Tax=Ideonella azotifigens TaxID=513160 RepID=A0ABN1K0R8_9BURK|nr:acyltransferase [Ideonella azotifigens]MCD2341584.1 acyltransferase [Ideonella azotifigens]